MVTTEQKHIVNTQKKVRKKKIKHNTKESYQTTKKTEKGQRGTIKTPGN